MEMKEAPEFGEKFGKSGGGDFGKGKGPDGKKGGKRGHKGGRKGHKKY